jgi:peptidyl-prolyl cis-trans isomerase C
MRRRILPLLIASAALSGASAFAGVGCGEDSAATDSTGPVDPSELVHGLTPEQARQTLAKIGPTEITVGQFAEELSSKGSFIRTRYASPERRREFLDQMIRFELLAQEAERRGYDELPEVERTRKQMMIRQFLEQRFETGGPESISGDDVRAYYESHRAEFHTPEQVRASHIQVRDRATAQRILRQLLAAPADLRLYRQLAEQHNQDPETRDRFGDLRFFSRPTERGENEPPVPDAVAETAFSIESIGGVYGEVVHTDRGWHVVKLTGRRAAMHRSLEEADRPIRNRLFRERREQGIETLLEELRSEADVQENLDMLEQVHIDIPEGDSPTVTSPRLRQVPGPRAPGGQVRNQRPIR